LVAFELFHDVADVHLDRALAHAQLVGDQLVRHAALQAVQNLGLPLGETLDLRLAGRAPRVVALGQQGSRRRKGAADTDQLHRSDRNQRRQARGNVAVHAKLKGRPDVLGVIVVGQDRHRSRRPQLAHSRQKTRDHGRRHSFGAGVDEDRPCRTVALDAGPISSGSART
jgi:hypothetical protein